MNKWALGVGGVALVVAAVWIVTSLNQGGAEVEFRYAPVAKGEVSRSTSATGTLVPLTKVDVKSKAGGKVVKLLVEEGSLVRKGDPIAYIDPEDTRSVFEQAQADVTTAQARVGQARTNVNMEAQDAENRVRSAEINLELAKTRLAKAEQTTAAQPILSQADVRTAQANLVTAQEALRNLEEVEVPQTRRDVEGQYQRAKADLDAQQREMARQETLLGQGYVSQSSVEKQRSALESSRATFRLAEQRRTTVDKEIDSSIKTARARVRQAEESLAQAKANQNRVPISQSDLREARESVRSAGVALAQARTARLNLQLRREDVRTAMAGAVRSKVAMKNAQVQLDSTTVVAPRDGVVTTKYLEEGTIIPPGTSTFAQGTSLVQISDTTQMEVECAVDEADIASVRTGQDVRVIIEAYPGMMFEGKVKRIFPAAESAQSVTTVKVRVSVGKLVPQADSGQTAGKGAGGGGRKPSAPILRPGMNATCEFIQFAKPAVLSVPQQAIQREDGKSYVRVKTADKAKPERREVKLGAVGNETTEVLEGLKEGEEVVVAEIDLKAMRDRQNRMQQQQQAPGGLGSLNRGGPSQSRATSGGGGGGGARASGGGR
ncbi:MAG: HlyD family efflux transporter periplasmic adaptor subunit [Armatimonadetes bacterium]|nr:HlyD family efflux transporter periplasmic adaptor subunit [Armatimonadota bacterium]